MTFESKSLKKQQGWLPVLTGGLVSSSAVGWCLYRSLKSPQFDYKEMIQIAACFAGGIGASSVLFYMCRKSTDEGKSTPEKDESNSITRDKDLLSVRFARVIQELDRRYEIAKAKEREDLSKTSENFASEYKTPLGKMDTCSDEMMGCQKAKLKQVILSDLNELKGYVKGALDPLPSARNTFWTTETGDEVRQYAIMIVKEYTNGMLPRIEQAIDEFVDSVYEAVKVLHYDKDHKTEACENDQQSKNAFAANMQPSESNQRRDNIRTETLKFFHERQKSACPNSGDALMLEADISHPKAEITKTEFSNPPSKWTEKQLKDFLLLKNENSEAGCPSISSIKKD